MSRRAALVTGASGGIGLVVARALAADGFDLTVTARRPDRLRAAADSLADAGTRVVAEPGDVSASEDVGRVVLRHAHHFGRLDALVLCAGFGTAGPIEGYRMRRFDSQIAVNVRAPFQMIGDSLPLLRQTAAGTPRTGARVIAVSSLAALVPEPGLAAYAASKAALVALCDAVNAEHSAEGVSATAVCPGYVDTDMSAWAHDRVPAADMITAGDVATLVTALTRLTPRAVVPHLPITRPGAALWHV